VKVTKYKAWIVVVVVCLREEERREGSMVADFLKLE
jgi:hypothetical protein